MSALEKMLKDWVSNGILSVEQSQKILAHEAHKPRTAGAYLYGLFVLGAVIIAIGVISLVAANWMYIPAAAKIAADLCLLFVLAVAVYLARERGRETLFEVLLVLFIGLCLASIGLVAQIYHTGGRPYQALLLWGAITAGAVAASRSFFAPFLWLVGLLAGASLWVSDTSIIHTVFLNNSMAFALSLTLLSAVLTLLRKTISNDEAQGAAFFTCTVITGLGSFIFAEVTARGFRYNGFKYDVAAYWIAYAMACAVFVWIWLGGLFGTAQKVLLSIMLAVFLIPFHPILAYGGLQKFVYAFLTISILLLSAVFMASIGRRGVFQTLLILVGLRFLVLYFEALEGLAITGAGLIISGLIIIGLSYLWYKFRSALTDWAAGLTR